MGYWIGIGSRRVCVELLLEESEKVVVVHLGETRGGTGEIPEGRSGVIHGLVRAEKEREMDGGEERYKEGESRVGRKGGCDALRAEPLQLFTLRASTRRYSCGSSNRAPSYAATC